MQCFIILAVIGTAKVHFGILLEVKFLQAQWSVK